MCVCVRVLIKKTWSRKVSIVVVVVGSPMVAVVTVEGWGMFICIIGTYTKPDIGVYIGKHPCLHKINCSTAFEI